MKKFLFAILLLLPFSCTKEPCWRCCTFINTTTSGEGVAPKTETTTTEIDTCYLSERKIKAYIKAETKTATVANGNLIITTESRCICLVISYLKK